MSNEAIADEIMALINSSPRSPRKQQLLDILNKPRAATGTAKLTDGVVTAVALSPLSLGSPVQLNPTPTVAIAGFRGLPAGIMAVSRPSQNGVFGYDILNVAYSLTGLSAQSSSADVALSLLDWIKLDITNNNRSVRI